MLPPSPWVGPREIFCYRLGAAGRTRFHNDGRICWQNTFAPKEGITEVIRILYIATVCFGHARSSDAQHRRKDWNYNKSQYFLR